MLNILFIHSFYFNENGREYTYSNRRNLMKLKFTMIFLTTLILSISACTPAVVPEADQSPEESPVSTQPAEEIVQTTITPAQPESTTSIPSMVAATSRGDKLAASDPSAVNLASGVPTLVEFFRFT
jgi:hypothetical protein